MSPSSSNSSEPGIAHRHARCIGHYFLGIHPARASRFRSARSGGAADMSLVGRARGVAATCRLLSGLEAAANLPKHGLENPMKKQLNCNQNMVKSIETVN